MYTVARIEKKFYIKHWNGPEAFIHAIQSLLPSETIKRIYPSRYVSSLYFDTPDYSFARAGLEGFPERRKTRLRWYSPRSTSLKSVDSNQIFLEHKSKIFDLTQKKAQPLCDFQRGSPLCNLLEKVRVLNPRELEGLVPTLINCYQREYYSLGREIRITFDARLRSADPLHLISEDSKELRGCIVEVKFGQEDEDRLLPFFNYFNSQKISKYNMGVQLVHLS